MAFNREKTMANAQKALRAGKVDKAIKEFERILDDDPNDIRSKLKMADLYVKGERFDDALRAYEDVAYSYAKQDLYEKAAAVYKQAMRISPEDPTLYMQLGDAYFRLGRLKDAVRVFHKAQKIYKRDGDDKAQRDILERMVQIDPDDVGLQIQLAERYEKDGLGNEARALFRESADQLKEEGRLDEYVQVVERMIYLSPQSVEMRKEVVRVYLGRGDEKHALKHLQHCFKINAQDIETLELLGSTFHRLGANDKAVLVYAELAALYERMGVDDRAASAYRTILSIDRKHPEALRYLGQDKLVSSPAVQAVPEATRPDQQVYEVDMDEYEEDDALDGIEFLDADDSEGIEAPPPTDPGDDPHSGGFLAFAEDAIRDVEDDADFDQIEAYPESDIGEPEPVAIDISEASLEIVEGPEFQPLVSNPYEDDEQITQFLTESDVFLKYGLLDRAEEAITKVLSLAPDSLGGRDQMRKLLLRMGDKRGAAHQLVEMARITTQDASRSAGYLEDAANLVDPDTLKTLAIGAGLQVDGDFDDAFIDEVSVGLDEVSSTVEGQIENVGMMTIDLPDLADEAEEDFMLSGESAVDDYSGPGGITDATDDEFEEEIDDDLFLEEESEEEIILEEELEEELFLDEEDSLVDEDPIEFEEVVEEEEIDLNFGDEEVNLADLDDFDMGGLEEFDGDMSLGEASLVELDVDNVNFDGSALKALDEAAMSGEVELNFSAEDADQMFDELFGGGGMFGDSEPDEQGIEELDLDEDDDFEGSPPPAFGARSLTTAFRGPATNPSIEIEADVNNSSLELGKTYKDMGLFSEAIEEFRHAMEDADAAPAALYNIALCHIELGEKSDAQTHLTQITQDEAMPEHWRSIASEKLGELSV